MDSVFSMKKLRNELTSLQEDNELPFSVCLVDENDPYKWDVLIIGPESTLYEGAVLKCLMTFPNSYPNMPPKFIFKTKMWHPNIFNNGEVCISILHPPVIDVTNPMETLDEKWKPVLGVKEIVLSILCIINEPNLDSPANIDAAIEFKNNYDIYKKKVRRFLEEEIY